MNCTICSRKAAENTELCGKCIVKVVEKRARKRLAKRRIMKDSRVLVVNDGRCEGEVNSYLVKKLVTSTKNIEYAKNLHGNSYDFVALPDTADTEAERFLDFMLNSNVIKSQKNAVKLLKDSMASEVADYAKIKRIKYAKKMKESSISLLLERLDRYKGTKFALAKISEKIKCTN